ncbi:MAG: DUF962 domain-containing protein [Bacteroidota bacterium]
MAEKKYKSLKEFYPYYLTEHADPVCRALHFIGTSGVFILPLIAIITQTWWLLALVPVAGYGFAWIGHALFERNKPATFTYPGWSLASDFIMYFDMITFRINRRLKEAQQIIGSAN